MPNDKNSLMPDDSSLSQERNEIESAIVNRINDDIDDARILRGWRVLAVILISAVAMLFYVGLGYFVFGVGQMGEMAEIAPSVAVTVLIVFAAIPTILVVSVAKAIFGLKSQAEAPFTPLHAIIQLMKDMKGG